MVSVRIRVRNGVYTDANTPAAIDWCHSKSAYVLADMAKKAQLKS